MLLRLPWSSCSESERASVADTENGSEARLDSLLMDIPGIEASLAKVEPTSRAATAAAKRSRPLIPAFSFGARYWPPGNISSDIRAQGIAWGNIWHRQPTRWVRL